MNDPAILFYTSDFLTGTLTMSNEQIGKYIKLLCLQHQKFPKYLTEKDMLNICITYDEDIFTKFIKNSDGEFFNQRMENEILRRKNYSESRRINRMSKKKKVKKICKTYVPHMENEDINEIINGIKEELLNSNSWQLIVARNKKLTEKEVLKQLNIFIDLQEEKEKLNREIKELQDHFSNWLTVQIEKGKIKQIPEING